MPPERRFIKSPPATRDTSVFSGTSPVAMLDRFARFTFLAIVLAFGLALAENHLLLLYSAVPVDVYEAGMPVLSDHIAMGKSPFSRVSQPVYAAVYPPLYNLIAAPLVSLFGNGLAIHRWLAAVFIWFCVALVFLAAWHRREDRLQALAAALFAYSALLFYATPIASPNAVGLFLYLLAVLIPWRSGFSNRSLFVSGICGVLAFYGKQYFVFSLATVSIYLFLFISKSRAVGYAAVSGIALLLSLAAVQAYHPLFLDNVILTARSATAFAYHPEHADKQLWFYATSYSAMLGVATIIFAKRCLELRGKRPALALLPRAENIKFMHSPLLPWRVDYIIYCILAGLVVFYFFIGSNRGNFATYLFQLVSPFFAIAVFRSMSRNPGLLKIALPLIVFGFWTAWNLLPGWSDRDPGDWDRIASHVESHETIYADPMLQHYLLAAGKTLYTGPYTAWSYYAMFEPRRFSSLSEGPDTRVISRRHILAIRDMVSRREFDLVLLRENKYGSIGATRFLRDVPDGVANFKQNYVLTETIPLYLTERRGGGLQRIQVWKPDPGA